MGGLEADSAEENVSRISVAYNGFVTVAHEITRLVGDCPYRQVLPAANLDMFYLILLDCELSLCRRLDSMIVSLGSETSCLWLHSKSNIRLWRERRPLEKACHVFVRLVQEIKELKRA